MIQCLRFFVDRNQKGWVKALPQVRFSIMNTIHSSTGFSPFQMRLGLSPRIVPALIEPLTDAVPTSATDVIKDILAIEKEAKDNLLAAKISQTIQANAHRKPDPEFAVGESVFLSTSNRHREYMHAGDNRVAKFMPRFDGPYRIVQANPEKSSYTLDIPNADVFPTFHISHLRPFLPNDGNLFPSREFERPAAITMDSGDDEWLVDSIIDERHGRRGQEFLVHYKGYGHEEDRWMTRRDVEELEALDRWLASKPGVAGVARRTTRGSTKKISASVLANIFAGLPPGLTFSLCDGSVFL